MSIRATPRWRHPRWFLKIPGNQDKTLLFRGRDILPSRQVLYRESAGRGEGGGGEGIVTRMILLEGVKPQYAVILPSVHAEAIITHPFNVSSAELRPRLQPVFSRVYLPPSFDHLCRPSPILRMASSRPGRITWHRCETMYAL